MKHNKKLNILIIIILVSLFFIGGWWLYSLRYQGSDIYSPYSSFRTDQMGIKVLYDSLESFPEFKVKRNFRPLFELGKPDQTTVFVIGCAPDLFAYEQNMKEIKDYVLSGGRAVISFTPIKDQTEAEHSTHKCNSCEPKEKTEEEKKQKKKEVKKKEKKQNEEGFIFNLKSYSREIRFPYKIESVKSLKLPPINIFSKNYFEFKGKGWKTLYSLRNKAAIIERQYPGGGSLVLCADSYAFSNEAIAYNRNADFIIYMLGNNKTIIFDETHLGAVKSRNIIWLAQKYNLIPFITALAITLILFIWRSLLVPYNYQKRSDDEISPEKFSNSSLVNMLRVNLPVNSVLRECWREFTNSHKSKMLSKQKHLELQKAVSETGNSVDIYNKAVDIYKKREGLKNE